MIFTLKQYHQACAKRRLDVGIEFAQRNDEKYVRECLAVARAFDFTDFDRGMRAYLDSKEVAS